MKQLLIDCDEVLLDWIPVFQNFAENKLGRKFVGYPVQYTLSDWMGVSSEERIETILEFNNHHEDFAHLPAFKKSEIYLPLIKNLGYELVVITACSPHPQAQEKRNRNLQSVFGDIFADVIYVENSGAKNEVLKKYEPTIFIEDNFDNAKMGADIGHESFVIRQPYNTMYESHNYDSITFVDDWCHIFKILKPAT